MTSKCASDSRWRLAVDEARFIGNLTQSGSMSARQIFPTATASLLAIRFQHLYNRPHRWVILTFLKKRAVRDCQKEATWNL
jgi:hypothetical protein